MEARAILISPEVGVISRPALKTGSTELDPITREEAQTRSEAEGPSVNRRINNPF